MSTVWKSNALQAIVEYALLVRRLWTRIRSPMIRARFFVAGTPAPQGSKRIVQPKGHARPMLLEMSKKLPAWRAAVETAALLARQRCGTIKTSTAIFATFWFQRPKKPARPFPSLDIDKLQRALFDGLVRGGLLADDSWIVDVTITKRWTEGSHEPGCEVTISDF